MDVSDQYFSHTMETDGGFSLLRAEDLNNKVPYQVPVRLIHFV